MPLCDRPHERFVDFAASRFVVSMECGLEVDGRVLERGEEVPSGVLEPDALRQVYQRPLRRIELIEYAFNDPDMVDLREACARKGVVLQQETAEASRPTARESLLQELASLSKADLVKLAKSNGVPTNGSASDIRDRLADLAG